MCVWLHAPDHLEGVRWQNHGISPVISICYMRSLHVARTEKVPMEIRVESLCIVATIRELALIERWPCFGERWHNKDTIQERLYFSGLTVMYVLL